MLWNRCDRIVKQISIAWAEHMIHLDLVLCHYVSHLSHSNFAMGGTFTPMGNIWTILSSSEATLDNNKKTSLPKSIYHHRKFMLSVHLEAWDFKQNILDVYIYVIFDSQSHQDFVQITKNSLQDSVNDTLETHERLSAFSSAHWYRYCSNIHTNTRSIWYWYRYLDPYIPAWSRMVPHGPVRSRMVPYGTVIVGIVHKTTIQHRNILPFWRPYHYWKST